MTAPQLAPPSNALAIAGFVLGVVSFVFCILWGLIGLFIAFVPDVLAIVFGFVGITTANRLAGRRRGFAIWAVVLGFVAPALALFHFGILSNHL